MTGNYIAYKDEKSALAALLQSKDVPTIVSLSVAKIQETWNNGTLSQTALSLGNAERTPVALVPLKQGSSPVDQYTAAIPCAEDIAGALALAKQGKTSETLAKYERYAAHLNSKAGTYEYKPQFTAQGLMQSCSRGDAIINR